MIFLNTPDEIIVPDKLTTAELNEAMDALREDGFQNPVVVAICREDSVRLMAAKLLDMERIPVSICIDGC